MINETLYKIWLILGLASGLILIFIWARKFINDTVDRFMFFFMSPIILAFYMIIYPFIWIMVIVGNLFMLINMGIDRIITKRKLK